MPDDKTPYCYRFGAFELDEAHFVFRHNNIVVPMPAKPWNLLLLLLKHAPNVVSHQQICQQVWAGRTATSGTVNQVLVRLRQFLADEDQALIKNARGVGFCFTGDLERVPPPINIGQLAVEINSATKLRGRQPWKLLRPLITCANAYVWLGEHQSTREQRVFKFAFDESDKSSLKSEVLAASLLADEGTEGFLPVLHWDFTEPPFFIELPYLDAPTLADWLTSAHDGVTSESSQIDWNAREARSVALIADIASVLSNAHACAIVHGDLSLNNVLVQADNAGSESATLIDFGSAQLAAVERIQALELSVPLVDAPSSSRVGRLLYASPEVLRGEPVSSAGDVYSLGVMLFQVLARDARRALSPGWENAVSDLVLQEDILAMCHRDPFPRPTAKEVCNRLRSLESRRQARLTEHQLAVQVANNVAGRRTRRRYLAAILLLAAVSGVAIFGWTSARENAQKMQIHLAQVDQLLTKTPDIRARNAGIFFARHVSDKVYAGTSLAVALWETMHAVDRELKSEPDMQFEAYLQLAQTARAISDQRMAQTVLRKLAGLPRSLRPDTLRRSEFNFAISLYLSGNQARAQPIFLRLAQEFKLEGDLTFADACQHFASSSPK